MSATIYIDGVPVAECDSVQWEYVEDAAKRERGEPVVNGVYTFECEVPMHRKAWRNFLRATWPEGRRALARKARVARRRWLGMHYRWRWEAYTGQDARYWIRR